MLYTFVKLLHILAAIVALGSNLTYGIWLARAARQPQALLFTLKTIHLIDSRLANPAYGISLLTGLIMVYLQPWPLATPWLLTALIIYFSVLLIGLLVYAPIARAQIRLAGTEGPASPAYAAVARRSTMIGTLVIVLVVIIVFLMVTKPQLWG